MHEIKKVQHRCLKIYNAGMYKKTLTNGAFESRSACTLKISFVPVHLILEHPNQCIMHPGKIQYQDIKK